MPAGWNRLADATGPGAVAQQLSVVTLGHVHVDMEAGRGAPRLSFRLHGDRRA